MQQPLAYPYNDTIHRCFRCGYCKFPSDWSDVTNCPPYARYRLESYSAGGRLWLIRAWVNQEMEWSPNLARIVYACVTCKNCVEKCPHSFNDDVVNMIVAARALMVDQGRVPKPVGDFLTHIQRHGNPYGIPARKRADWIKDLDIAPYDGQAYLFYVGDEGAFDSRAQKAARATARLFCKAGLSFGVLGAREVSDGNEVEMLGEHALLEDLAEKNLALFAELGVRRIITLSPHSYNAFKNLYPQLGGDFKVYHHSRILADLIKKGKLTAPDLGGLKITYHDPCFLGRWNREYEASRRVILAIPGAAFTEMGRNRAGALCCGGGSGNFFTDFLGGSDESPARIRAREARETGASLLAVACPNCLTMMEDAVKAEGLADQIQVKDISEILDT